MTEQLDMISLAGDSLSPIVLTSEWKFATEPGSGEGINPLDHAGWKATFKRLWFCPATGSYEEADWNQEEHVVFAPLSPKKKPSSNIGDRLFSVYRGRWEAFEGNTSHGILYGVVMEAIPQSSDTTAELPDGIGRVKVLGKIYDADDSETEEETPPEPKYDMCVCLELGETEELLAGTQVKLTGPTTVKNPDFDSEEEESDDNPKHVTFYHAVETEKIYSGYIKEELHPGGSAAFTVKTSKESRDFTVYSALVEEGTILPAGHGVEVERRPGPFGPRLEIVNGPCVKGASEA